MRDKFMPPTKIRYQ